MLAVQKVLIIGNSPDYFTSLVDKLQEHEYEAVVVSESFEAFRVATSENPALVVIDVVLPKMDGLSVCKLLKSKAATRNTPIIITSSSMGDNMEEVASRAQADLLIQKKEKSEDLYPVIAKQMLQRFEPGKE